jgi:hypothetical protein
VGRVEGSALLHLEKELFKGALVAFARSLTMCEESCLPEVPNAAMAGTGHGTGWRHSSPFSRMELQQQPNRNAAARRATLRQPRLALPMAAAQPAAR